MRAKELIDSLSSSDPESIVFVSFDGQWYDVLNVSEEKLLHRDQWSGCYEEHIETDCRGCRGGLPIIKGRQID